MGKNNERITAYIGEKNPAEREKLICFLEKEGVVLDTDESRGRQEIVEGILPIAVNIEARTYRMMGNVTCAAGVASSGRIVKAEDFYESYDV